MDLYAEERGNQLPGTVVAGEDGQFQGDCATGSSEVSAWKEIPGSVISNVLLLSLTSTGTMVIYCLHLLLCDTK